MKPVAKIFIIIGILFLIIGLILLIFPNIFKSFGKLPGDIQIKKDNFVFYAPITSMIIISIILTIIINIISKFFNK